MSASSLRPNEAGANCRVPSGNRVSLLVERWGVGIAGTLTMLIGGGHLLAWLGGIMASRGVSVITMKTNAALCLLLLGVALLLRPFREVAPWRRWVAQACAAVALVVGALTLSENLFGWNLGIDQLLAEEPPGALGVIQPNRMGTPAALGFLLAGVSLLLLQRSGRRTRIAQWLAMAVCLIGLLSTVGFLYGAEQLYGIARVTAIAWPTATALLLLGLGLLVARPAEGLMAQVTDEGAGGLLLRQLLLPILLLPLGLGWLRLEGERAGLHDTPMGTALLTLAFLVIFSVIAYHTSRKVSRSASELHESELRYRTLFTNMTEGFALGEAICSDQGGLLDFRFLEINDAFEQQTGLDRSVLGRPITEALPNVEWSWIETYGSVALTGRSVRFEKYNQDTHRFYDVFCYSPTPGRFAILFRDVTQEREVSEAVRVNEERLALAARAGGFGVFDQDHRTGALHWSPVMRQIHDLPTDQPPDWDELLRSVHPDDRDAHVAAVRAAHDPEGNGVFAREYRIVRSDGSVRWISAHAQTFFEGEGNARIPVRTVGVKVDITDRKQADADLRRSRELLAEAEKLSHTGAWEWDLATDQWSFSEEWRSLHGCSNRTLTAEELLAIAHPDDRAAIACAFDNVRQGQASYDLEHRIVRVDNGEVRVVRAHGHCMRDGAGHVVRVYGFAQDITEQKQAEEELRRWKNELEIRVEERTAELAAANRELEAFGYTVSHDLRAPLRHIVGFIEMLDEHAGASLDEEGRRYLRVISQSAGRMGALIDDLLTLSRLGRAAMAETEVDLGQLVEEARAELAPQIDGRAIDWQIGPLPIVRGDPTLLRNVVVNLLSNAVKYTRNRNPAQIEIGAREQDGEVVCFVRDNGAGFDMRFGDKLFGVFQRLHPAGQFEGTGIGLASVRRIIQRHGGRTWAEGAVDQGATFSFSLPQRRDL